METIARGFIISSRQVVVASITLSVFARYCHENLSNYQHFILSVLSKTINSKQSLEIFKNCIFFGFSSFLYLYVLFRFSSNLYGDLNIQHKKKKNAA